MATAQTTVAQSTAAVPTQVSAVTPAPLPVRAATAEKPTTSSSTRGSAETYRVKKGDTLLRIAQRNNTTVEALLKANPGLSPRRLQPGKRINLN